MRKSRFSRLAALSLLLALGVTTFGCGGDSSSIGADGYTLVGPEAVTREDTDDFVFFFPTSLENEDTWPALVWFNGSSGYTEEFNYNDLLRSIASWGFVVIGGKFGGMNPAGSDQRTELLRRNAEVSDALFTKVDTQKIAVAGHSLGSIQATGVVDEYDLLVAIQGALASESTNVAPTLYLTAKNDTVIPPEGIVATFSNAFAPAWLLNHETADHTTPRGDAGPYREPTIAFLRWQFLDDDVAADWYEGMLCQLCTDTQWTFDVTE